MNPIYSRLATAAAMAMCLAIPHTASAQTAPSLGTAAPFAVLGGSTVTNTGPSVITGDLGVSPGSAVTGFPPGLVVGTTHAADAVALAAQTDLTTAYNALSAQGCTADLTGQDLGGKILTPGVYCFATSAQLTGTLTLDAQANPAAVFIFKIGSTLTTASNSNVLITGGGLSCNVFWQVQTSATLGTTTAFAGNILALTSITLNTNAQVLGRTLARNGAVTLDTNTVNASACAVVPAPPVPPLPPAPPVPPPGGCPVITAAPATLPNAAVATTYTQQLTASGGTAPYTFAVTSGALPAGVTLSTGGLLSGTPTASGAATFTVRATDANGCAATAAYSLTVVTPVPTLAGWAMIALTGVLGLTGIVAIRRRGRGPQTCH